MLMQPLRLLPLLLALALLTTQCRPTLTVEPATNPNNPAQWLGHTYRITQVQLSDAQPSPPTAFRLQWTRSGRCLIQLSANTCGLSYEADDAQIAFGGGACTEMCCDTPHEMAIVRQLSDHTWQYMMTDQRIELFQRDPAQRIILERTSTSPDLPE